jgi:uncharacterized protein YggU (UPF0235/DUF167 family)
MLPEAMGRIRVRVIPRSSRAGTTMEGGRVVVRVHAAPVGGRATDEARRSIAAALGVGPSRVLLRAGATARDKVFEVQGVSSEEAVSRLRAR